ncbi:MAG: LuxR C-terminal-related transcriptional regulator [Venatoribacter sp.]
MTKNKSPILIQTSRLSPPRRGRGVLSRPRLESMANQLLDYRLTALKAPPGFGKTTLAAAWLEALSSQQMQSAWLALEENDDTPAHLLYCLAVALQHAMPERQFDSSNLSEDMPFVSAQVFAAQLSNDISSIEKPLLMVLDDCHWVKEEVLETALSLLLRHPPENLHLLLISRNPIPNKILQQLKGEPFLELDAEHLRFQPDETKALLSRAGIELSAADLAGLQSSTAGWSTAIRAYMLSTNKNFASVPRSLNLLFSEMLEQQEADFLQKLLPLSLLESFNEAMLKHCYQSEAPSFIDKLEQGQFFISYQGEQNQWLKFHPLFKDYLAQSYLHQSGEQERNAFRLTCALWLADNQEWGPAISLALAAQATSQAEQWISQCAMDLVEQGELYTLLQWERQLREQMPVLPPAMRLALGWASCLAMQQERAQELLNTLKHEDSIINQYERRALQAMVKAFAGQGEQAMKLAQECEPHFYNRPWIYNVLVNVQRYGHLQTGNWQAFYSLPPMQQQSLSRSRYVFNKLYQYGIEAIAEIQQGRLDTAEQKLNESIRTLEENHSSNVMLYALPRVFLAQIFFLQGQYDKAQAELDKCHAVINIMGFPELAIAANGTQAKLLLLQNNTLQARALIEELEAVGLKRLCPRLLAFSLLERCRLSLREHKNEEANACVKFLQQLDQEQKNPPQELHYAYLLAKLSLAAIQKTPLHELTEQVQVFSDKLSQTGKNLLNVELQLAYNLALQANDGSKNQAHIEHWLQVAKVYGLNGLLDYFQLSDNTPEQDNQDALLSLTVKERLILQEVAHGLSNKEIARNMNVAPETIKSHMKNIFAKLGVNNRTQAALFIQDQSLA